MSFTTTYSVSSDMTDFTALSVKVCKTRDEATEHIRAALVNDVYQYLIRDTLCTNHPAHLFYKLHEQLVADGLNGLTLETVEGMVRALTEKDLLQKPRYRKWSVQEHEAPVLRKSKRVIKIVRKD